MSHEPSPERLQHRKCPNRDCRSLESYIVLTRRCGERELDVLAVKCKRCGLMGPHGTPNDEDALVTATAAWNGMPRCEDADVDPFEIAAARARFFRERSNSMYRDGRALPSGSDAVDAERDRLTASALGKVLMGESVESALEWYRRQWADFTAAQNAKLKAAPKVKYGPSEGGSVIGCKVATPSNGEQGELNFLMACKGVIEATRLLRELDDSPAATPVTSGRGPVIDARGAVTSEESAA